MARVIFRNGKATTVHTEAERRAAAIDRGPVPTTITRLQAMRELQSRDLWDDLQTQFVLNPDVHAEWDIAVELIRSDELVVSIAAAIGVDDSTLDDIYREAAKR